MEIEILYEDNHVIVAVKPPGVPSQQDVTGDPDMLSLLKNYIEKKYDKPGEAYLGLVHRLDRPTGGVMVFARTSKAAARLSDEIRRGGMEKEYLAVLTSSPPRDSDTLSGYIVKDGYKNVSRMADKNEPGAKTCSLFYEVAGRREGLTLVRVRLHTGRSHRIRVQMADMGCPLFGDVKYGAGDGRFKREREELALFAHTLIFSHPTKKERLTFSALPPNVYPWSAFEL